MNKHLRLSAWLVLLTVIGIPQHAAATGVTTPPNDYAYSLESVRDSSMVCTRLDNGIAVVFAPNINSGNDLCMTLMINAGAANQNETQSGYAHLVEHLVFCSVDKNGHTAQQRLEALGLTMGHEYNAVTTFDNTRLSFTLHCDNLPLVSSVMDILTDIVSDFTPTALSVNHEKTVVTREYMEYDDITIKKLISTPLSPASPYFGKSVIGSPSSIKDATAESLRRFFNDHWQPSRMAFIISGNIQPSTALMFARKLEEVPVRNGAPRITVSSPLPDKLSAFSYTSDDKLRPYFNLYFRIDSTPRPQRLSQEYINNNSNSIWGYLLWNMRLEALKTNGKTKLAAGNGLLDINRFYNLAESDYCYSSYVSSRPDSLVNDLRELLRLAGSMAKYPPSLSEWNGLRNNLQTLITNGTGIFAQTAFQAVSEIADNLSNNEAIVSQDETIEMAKGLYNMPYDEVCDLSRKYFSPDRLSISFADNKDICTPPDTLIQLARWAYDHAFSPDDFESYDSDIVSIINQYADSLYRHGGHENFINEIKPLYHLTVNGLPVILGYDAYLFKDPQVMPAEIVFLPRNAEPGKLSVSAVSRRGLSDLADMLSDGTPGSVNSLKINSIFALGCQDMYDSGSLKRAEISKLSQHPGIVSTISLFPDMTVFSLDSYISCSEAVFAWLNMALQNGFHLSRQSFDFSLRNITASFDALPDNDEYRIALARDSLLFNNDPLHGSFLHTDMLPKVSHDKVNSILDSLFYAPGDWLFIVSGDFYDIPTLHSIASYAIDAARGLHSTGRPLSICDIDEKPDHTHPALMPASCTESADITISHTPDAQNITAGFFSAVSTLERPVLANMDQSFIDVCNMVLNECLLKSLRFNGEPLVYNINVNCQYNPEYSMLTLGITYNLNPADTAKVESIIRRTLAEFTPTDIEELPNIVNRYLDLRDRITFTQSYPVENILQLIHTKHADISAFIERQQHFDILTDPRSWLPLTRAIQQSPLIYIH